MGNSKHQEVNCMKRTLQTEPWQEDDLEKMFSSVHRLKNDLITITKNNRRAMESSPEYSSFLELYKEQKEPYEAWKKKKANATKEEKKELAAAEPPHDYEQVIKDLNKQFNFSGERDFYKILDEFVPLDKKSDKMIRRYKHYNIPSSVARGVANHVWNSWEKVLYGVDTNKNENKKKKKSKIDRVRYEKWDDCNSIPNTAKNSGIVFDPKNDQIWVRHKKRRYSIKIKKSCIDDYYNEVKNTAQEFLCCSIVREWVDGKRCYYMTVSYAGKAPATQYNGRELVPGKNILGLDLGTHKIAYSTEDRQVSGFIYFPKTEKGTQFEIECQRRMDEISRELNPDNYNENGTIKKGKKKWVYNEEYYSLKHLKASSQCKRAKNRQMEQNIKAKQLAEIGVIAAIEQNDVKEWAERQKGDTEISEKTGRPKSKAGFGEAIGCCAPSTFVKRYKQIVNSCGGSLREIDKNYAATKICSVCGFQNEDLEDVRIREWTCPECHTHHHRDLNAAVNIVRQIPITLSSYENKEDKKENTKKKKRKAA